MRLRSSRPGKGTAEAKFASMVNAAVKKLETAELAARKSAATTATMTTRKHAGRERRQDAGDRPGRPAGNLNKTLRWRPLANQSMVGFDLSAADSQSRYWIIQEIGTDESAVIFRANRANPVGRPKKEAIYVKTVRSQIGRRIPKGLAFGTAPGGKFQLPGAARKQQIYPIETLSGVPPWGIGRAPRIRIRREIVGKRMVHFGGQKGFRQYEQAVLAAAQQAFDGHPKRS